MPYTQEFKTAADFKAPVLKKSVKRKITAEMMKAEEEQDKLHRTMRWAETEKKNDKKRREQDPKKMTCIFCLEAQQDQHLIVSIGDEAYLTYSKGGITQQHMLLLPI